jgi:hypothetical protein
MKNRIHISENDPETLRYRFDRFLEKPQGTKSGKDGRRVLKYSEGSLRIECGTYDALNL